MRASEFVREVTDPKKPPAPGSKEYNASKASFLTYIQRFVASYNNNIATLVKSTGNELDYKTVYSDFLKKFKDELKDQGAKFILDRDFDNIFKDLPNPETLFPKPKSPKPTETPPTSAPSFDKEAFQKRAASAKANKAQARRTKESVSEAYDANYVPIGSVGSISRVGNGPPQITLQPKFIDDVATSLTDRFYANRQLAATNKTVWQQLSGQTADITSGGDSGQRVLTKILGVDPRNPQFAQVLSNVLSDKKNAEKITYQLNNYLPPTTKEKTSDKE
jgi:hypothetical protein